MTAAPAPPTAAVPAAPGAERPWLAFLLAVVVTHHLGTLLAPLGETVARSRWADWVDLLVPWAVLVPAAVALARAGATRRQWVLLGVGVVLYVEGHGIHLGANSIGNVTPTELGHLWDEVVGHYVWYGGLCVVVGVLADALRVPRPGPLRLLLAAGFGITWFTNSIEGGTPVLGVVVALVLVAWSWPRRRQDGVALDVLVAYALSLALLAGFGLWQGGFPQFTELGWV